MNNDILLTLDTDWAPDFAIDGAADVLIEKKVKATWLITHSSPAVNRLKNHPHLFELGIHPNFLPSSTHGRTIDEVLRHCLKIVPDAVSMRAHSLFTSTPILSRVIETTDIQTDLSLFLPHAHYLQPVKFWWKKQSLIRIPFFFEDDFEMESDNPRWQIAQILPRVFAGLKIFNFHPIHIYLNSSDLVNYERLKKSAAVSLNLIKEQQARPFILSKSGTKTLFLELVNRLSTTNSLRVKDLSLQYYCDE